MNEKIKKLTGKNPKDYEPIASEMINNCDTELFQELVRQDDFLFDFVKHNVAQRLQKAVNVNNFRNLLEFMKYYSPSYEDFIALTLAKFSNEDLIDEILEIFQNGTEDEKTYCAKFFSYIQVPFALRLLRENAFSENYALANNCAATLGIFEDDESYNQALKKLYSTDDFEQFEGVNFLISYGDKSAVPELIKLIKKSSMSENIAGQIPYLEDLQELLEEDFRSALVVLNNIINGLAEIIPLTSVLDFNLYDIFTSLCEKKNNSAVATVLINAKVKFETLTENDEYLYDEDKNTQNEVWAIKEFFDLQEIDLSAVDCELEDTSDFVLTALDFSRNIQKIRALLKSANGTIVLKSAQTLKNMNVLGELDRQTALENLKEDYLKAVIQAL